jgi:hypothetical protein
MVKLQLFVCQFFFTSCHDSPPEGAGRFRCLNRIDVVCDKEVPFGVSSLKIIFLGEYPFPELFKGHFAWESKKTINF